MPEMMQVIDFKPYSWFLMKNGEDYYIDVNCNYSAVGFSRLIKLTEHEIENYSEQGKAFIDSFAEDIQYHALSVYSGRNLTGEIESMVHEAILAFNKKNASR